MAITFRGQASRLNKETKGRNQVGFQDKSAAGGRQGVGGGNGAFKAAISSFDKRNTSPAKIKKNFYGGEAYFQDGYGGDLGSPAKKSCSPITAKAKNSPLKINQALVDGAGSTGKQFLDTGAIVKGALTEPDSEKGKIADLSE